MRKIKITRACNVNGSQYKLAVGDELDEAKTGSWIIDYLLAAGKAEVKRKRNKKTLGEQHG